MIVVHIHAASQESKHLHKLQLPVAIKGFTCTSCIMYNVYQSARVGLKEANIGR